MREGLNYTAWIGCGSRGMSSIAVRLSDRLDGPQFDRNAIAEEFVLSCLYSSRDGEKRLD